MAIFKLSGKVTVSTYTEVDAPTLEEAIGIAASRDAVIGGTGSAADPEESWVVDDADGVPFDISEE